MKNSVTTKIFLAFSGLIAIGIGSGLLFAPVEFEASAGIILGEDINLLSEMRASGGAILATGILIILGVLIPKLAYLSVVLSSLMYLSYGASRIFGMMVDGMPNNSIVAATTAEIIIGLISILVLLKFDKRQMAV